MKMVHLSVDFLQSFLKTSKEMIKACKDVHFN